MSCDILHSSPSLSIPCSKVVEGAVGDTPDGAGTDTACSRIAARLWIVEQVSHLARASVKWSSAGSGALQLRTADSGIARAGQQQAQRAPSHGSKGTTSTLTWSTIAVHRWGEGGAFWTPREVLAQPRTHISSAASQTPPPSCLVAENRNAITIENDYIEERQPSQSPEVAPTSTSYARS